MIQSGKFDSSNMDIKKLAVIINIRHNRLIEIIGAIISILGVLLLIALISYSRGSKFYI